MDSVEISETTSTPRDVKRRNAISNVERRSLRKFAQDNPKTPQRLVKQWFEATFGRVVNQSTISDSLSSKYSHLDLEDGLQKPGTWRREKHAKWPELEVALIDWVRRSRGKVPITEGAIKAQAARFWSRLPACKDVEEPTFSNGWVCHFKSRHGVKGHKSIQDLPTPITSNVAEQLLRCQSAVAAYAPKDVFNFCETLLYWRATPNFLRRDAQGICVDNDKMVTTLMLCCNADGTEKLPLWAIGKGAEPRSFTAAKVDPKAFDIKWMHNGKAAMTYNIMLKWLRWFDERMTGRRVLLLLDDFYAHTSAVQELVSNQKLRHVEICWMYDDTSAIHQPLRQGIIVTLKAIYRNQWLEYMLLMAEHGRSAVRIMTILRALRWISEAWSKINPATIEYYWRHLRSSVTIGPDQATLINKEAQALLDNVSGMIGKLREKGVVTEWPSVEDFIHPTRETQVFEAAYTAEDDILAESDQTQLDHDPDDIIDDMPRIGIDAAMQSLMLLRRYEEQQLDANPDIIRQLSVYEGICKERKARGEAK